MEKRTFEKGFGFAHLRQNAITRRLFRKERISAAALVLVLVFSFLVLEKCYRSSSDCQQLESDPLEGIRPAVQEQLNEDDGSGNAKSQETSEQAWYRSSAQKSGLLDEDLESTGNGNSNTKYVEVLGNNYKPKLASMPSWLPKGTHGSSGRSTEGLTKESQMIIANNRDVASYTLEPEADSLLILTPVKNNAKHLARYFALLDKIKYPRDRISLAFLVSDSTDNTQQMLIESRQWYQEKAPAEMRFQRFEIYRQDFFYSLSRSQRHLRSKQRERRIMMATARNYLWTRALQNEQWVLWIDGDLEYYPPNIVRDLMAYEKDVIVPNCVVRRKTEQNRWKHSVYDRNAWQETPKSLKMINKLKEDDFLVEGYKSLRTHRKYLDNFSKNETIVPLDGVGGTFTLVKAHVHRSGVGFPAWLFQHQVETEGFAKLAKAHGYGVFGLPFYYVRHVVG